MPSWPSRPKARFALRSSRKDPVTDIGPLGAIRPALRLVLRRLGKASPGIHVHGPTRPAAVSPGPLGNQRLSHGTTTGSGVAEEPYRAQTRQPGRRTGGGRISRGGCGGRSLIRTAGIDSRNRIRRSATGPLRPELTDRTCKRPPHRVRDLNEALVAGVRDRFTARCLLQAMRSWKLGGCDHPSWGTIRDWIWAWSVSK